MELAWPKGEGAQSSTKETLAITSSSSQFPLIPILPTHLSLALWQNAIQMILTRVFHSENRRNWVSWGEKQSRIWFSREGRDEKFCFGGWLKAKREEEEDDFFVEDFFLREISAIGAIAEDF